MLVKSGFSRLAEDSFGHTMQSSECISLLRCTRDIKPHLWGLNVVDASLRSEIQSLWARVGTETNFMLMHRSIRNFNFPPVEIELLKISSSNSNRRGQNYVQMPYPSSFFLFWKKKTRATHGYFIVVHAWGMGNLNLTWLGWGIWTGNVSLSRGLKK
mgnify:CR=1 FL=1